MRIIGHLHKYAAVLERARSHEPGDPARRYVHHQARRIVCHGALRQHGRGRQPGYGVDLRAQRFATAHLRRPVVPGRHEHRPVDRRHQQIGGARRLQQRQRPLYARRRNAAVAQMQRGRLRQRIERLVLAVPPEIRISAGARRQRLRKREMRAVRRVHQQERAVRMRHLCERRQVGAISIGARGRDQHGRRTRALQRRFKPLRIRHGGQARPLVRRRRLEKGFDTRQRRRRQRAAMAVAVQQQPVVRVEGKQHALQRRRRTVDQQKGGARPICARYGALRLGNAPRRRMQVVGHGQLCHVIARRRLRQQPPHAAPLVAGHVEACAVRLRIIAQHAGKRVLRARTLGIHRRRLPSDFVPVPPRPGRGGAPRFPSGRPPQCACRPARPRARGCRRLAGRRARAAGRFCAQADPPVSSGRVRRTFPLCRPAGRPPGRARPGRLRTPSHPIL